MSNKKYHIGDLNSDVTERIEKVRELLGFKKKNAFCDAIGFSKSSYSNITGDRDSKPNIELLHKIAKQYPNVNFIWILIGAGSIFNEEAPEQLFHEIKPNFVRKTEEENSDLVQHLKKQIEELKEDKADLRDRIKEINDERKLLFARISQLTDEFFEEKARLQERIDELKRELSILQEDKTSA